MSAFNSFSFTKMCELFDQLKNKTFRKLIRLLNKYLNKCLIELA